MRKTLHILPFFIFLLAPVLMAQPSEAETELTQLLNEFLKGASENNIAMHDRFWAEDLIYTSSSGERYGKQRIMDGLRNSGDETRESEMAWSADDITIRTYGDVAVVAFKLVGKTVTPEGAESRGYLNSGTFIKRNGQWKAVNWQATKVPD